MKNSFSLLLALRYLQPKRSFVSVITLISIIGVVLGVAVLITVIAVMKGFELRIKESYFNFDPHVSIRPYRAPDLNEEEMNWRDLRKALEGQPGIAGISPYVGGLVIMEVGMNQDAVRLLGVAADDEQIKEKYGKTMLEGHVFDLEASESIVISKDLADTYKLGVGDVVTLYSPDNLKEVLREMRKREDEGKDKSEALEGLEDLILPQDLTITGILDNQFHPHYVLVPLHVSKELLSFQGDSVAGLSMELSDPYAATQIKRQISDAGLIPANWEVFTWGEMNAPLFEAIQGERSMMFFVLFIISLVAAFCVMNTMITITVQKRHEIGIMTALGGTPSQLLRAFLLQGMIVAALGVGLGFLVGIGLLATRQHIIEILSNLFGVDLLIASIYGEGIPAKLMATDAIVICSGAFLVCSLAALIPAWIAASTDPAKSLRSS